MLGEHFEAALLLVSSAENADEHEGRMEISRHIHVVDADQSGVANGKLAANDLADFAFQELVDSLMSERWHVSNLNYNCLKNEHRPWRFARGAAAQSFWATFSIV
jgi:hypothetical protein